MAQQPREQWGTRAGFLLAAIGSAIGLGNIWRFPYVAYDNGGGAFIVPYLIALLTAGIPLLILSYAIGHRFRASPPKAFRQLSRPAEAIGWWQVIISFVVAVYYAVIIAWAIRYAGFSLGQQWGDDTETFMVQEFLQTSGAGGISSYIPGIAVPLVAVWVLVLLVLCFGIRRGIEWANKIFIPLLVVLFSILVVRALFLDGAAEGLNALFQPQWSEIANSGVWVAAYGQIFFSLSIGFGIMVTYASYLRRRSDLPGSALVAGLANSSFELLAGIGVFATLGFMASTSEAGILDLIGTGGVGLAFMAFPEIISNMPFGADAFGLLFFSSLVIAGLSSLISIVQVVVSAVQDRTGMGRIPAVLTGGGLAAVVSIVLFPTDQGLNILDTVDNFINNYGIALASLVLVVVVAWLLRRLPMLQNHAQQYSSVSLSGWWKVCLGVITPVILGVMLWQNLQTDLTETYGDFPETFVNYAGWGVAIGAVVLAIVLALLPWKNASTSTSAEPEEAGAGEEGKS